MMILLRVYIVRKVNYSMYYTYSVINVKISTFVIQKFLLFKAKSKLESDVTFSNVKPLQWNWRCMMISLRVHTVRKVNYSMYYAYSVINVKISTYTVQG